MPRAVIQSPGSVFVNSPAPAGGRGAPIPAPSPIVLTEPGEYRRRVPLDVETVTIEAWGGGARGNDGGSSAAYSGGTGGGYAKCTLGAPFFVSGSVLVIGIGKGGDSLDSPDGFNTTVTVAGKSALTAYGSQQGASEGGLVAVSAGITGGAVGKAAAGHAAVGTTGGAGGKGGGAAGGAGGAGGAIGKAGSAGVNPGGAGGSAGQGVGIQGGVGAGGRVTITW